MGVVPGSTQPLSLPSCAAIQHPLNLIPKAGVSGSPADQVHLLCSSLFCSPILPLLLEEFLLLGENSILAHLYPAGKRELLPADSDFTSSCFLFSN